MPESEVASGWVTVEMFVVGHRESKVSIGQEKAVRDSSNCLKQWVLEDVRRTIPA
jgi:hypothetical protein